MRIALVSYINTTPFTDGLRHVFSEQEVQLDLLSPADCAKALESGNADVALLPVGAIPDFKDIKLLPNWCIGADGAVESVFIVSQRPIQEIETLYLDPHSRSSNGLAHILLQYYWNINPEIKKNSERNYGKVKDRNGAVIIGDKAIRLRDKFRYVYDLSAAWKNLTGMPFTFAVWAYRPGTVSAEHLEKLDEAFSWGVAHASESAKRWSTHFKLDPDFSREYLTRHISYEFGRFKHQSMRIYLSALEQVETTADLHSLYFPAASKVA
ncbi:MAG: menaquinone biosynthesis protein [Bacteroidia bacterium]